MTNTDLSQSILSLLKQTGVKNIAVCAGARNAPLVLQIQNDHDFNVYSFFEERSAAFFCLGLSKTLNEPVAILTTSGTAVAELLPATIEAYYQNLPLILVTADRPKVYRGTGSPQSIDQSGIFLNYASCSLDIDKSSNDVEFEWDKKTPMHLNICFDEPLLDSKTGKKIEFINKFCEAKNNSEVNLEQFTKPLLIVGGLDTKYKAAVIELIEHLGCPVYAESVSHLKNSPELTNNLITSSEAVINYLVNEKICDSVIRLGSVPTLRFWRDLEFSFKDVPVLNITEQKFSGLSRQSQTCDYNVIKKILSKKITKNTEFKQKDEFLQNKKRDLFETHPMSEMSLVKELSTIIGSEALYIGNSLPIRHWDAFADVNSKQVYANRGANGIDGQVSTYLGWAQNLKCSYCVVGDLTAMYDLAALSMTEQLNDNKYNIIIINNSGGQIFNRIFSSTKFINQHQIHFEHWAAMFGWNYSSVNEVTDLEKIKNLSQKNIIEIIPSKMQTDQFWAEWDQLCKNL